MKIFFQFIWTLVSFIYLFVDAQDGTSHITDPFLLSIDVNSPRYLELPSTEIPSLDDPLANKKVQAACPAEIPEMDILKKISPKTEYCLFEKTFKENERRVCTNEVRPMLHAQYDDLNHKQMTCGTKEKKHLLFEFGFYYCGTLDGVKQLSDKTKLKTPEKYVKPRSFPIFEICLDTSNRKALWSKYSVMTPAIFQDLHNEQKLLKETGEDPEAISTADLPSIPQSYFDKLKGYFPKHNRKKSTTNKVQETFMVPMEHMALRMWRKTVNHFINVAPLLVMRGVLMNAINSGIKKVAFKLHSEGRRLSIYTAVREVSSKGKKVLWNSVSSPNVWYKLLYEEKEKLAAMIVLDNRDPAKPSATKACNTPADCKTMINWYDINGYPYPLTQDDVKDAYCCDPKSPEVETIFNVHLEIAGNLNLDWYFTQNNASNSNHAPPTAPPIGDERGNSKLR